MKSLESFSENVIGFQTVHAIIGHRVCPCDLFLRYNVREGKSEHETIRTRMLACGGRMCSM